ncbi:MAG: methyltransferase domain-containing protein [Bacteroidia bacterium]|nr:methyltransferase domain-containing protein [Sphingobacteriaceae bacterium]MBK7309352.1 methyltransferase domain-containing protein [Sphingobacteriaceae bacterium]MBK7819005.1 methyltransferase domain-containing protein [Sphingobacteriaceae bacterium]MBP9069059.1 methyltransferase domain-containing protein [Bacteroidia bacterium]
MECRFCKHKVETEFADLVNSPASNSYLTAEQLNEPEVFYPLKVMACEKCFLVQVDEYKKSEDIFNADYAYFSSFSTSWLAHSKKYTEMMIARFGYNEKSLVTEVASNDGYLLQYFKEKNVPVLGIEPTANTAAVAIKKGIPSVVDFFGVRLATKLAGEGKKTDLLLGNNVLAHVPDINDFVGGMKVLVKEGGVVTMEFPHLYQLVLNNQFDTIYHEHFSYLSFTTVSKIFEAQGLVMFDVEEVPTHGGSLRIFAKHKEDSSKPIGPNVAAMLQKEKDAGMLNIEYYKNFQVKVETVKNDLLEFLLKQKRAGKKVAAYGAAAKGNTLLNYCGIKNDMISFAVDANPAKQNKFMPASHIPIVQEDRIKKDKPDFIIILPWNIKDEIVKQLDYVNAWGCKFVVPIPKLQIL